MSTPQISAFFDLVSVDQQIYLLEQNVQTLREQITHKQSEKNRLIAGQKDIIDARHTLQKEVMVCEKLMDELNQEETKRKNQLNTAQSLKQYNSCKAELDAIHEEQQKAEQELLSLWNSFEQAQRDEKNFAKQLDEKVPIIEQDIKNIHIQIDELMTLNKELIEKRLAHQLNVSQEWLEKYISMRSSIIDPVVPLNGDACSACFNHLTNQDRLRINRGALLQCKGCFRLLYTTNQ